MVYTKNWIINNLWDEKFQYDHEVLYKKYGDSLSKLSSVYQNLLIDSMNFDKPWSHDIFKKKNISAMIFDTNTSDETKTGYDVIKCNHVNSLHTTLFSVVTTLQMDHKLLKIVVDYTGENINFICKINDVVMYKEQIYQFPFIPKQINIFYVDPLVKLIKYYVLLGDVKLNIDIDLNVGLFSWDIFELMQCIYSKDNYCITNRYLINSKVLTIFDTISALTGEHLIVKCKHNKKQESICCVNCSCC